jgi:hypothetical protein
MVESTPAQIRRGGHAVDFFATSSSTSSNSDARRHLEFQERERMLDVRHLGADLRNLCSRRWMQPGSAGRRSFAGLINTGGQQGGHEHPTIQNNLQAGTSVMRADRITAMQLARQSRADRLGSMGAKRRLRSFRRTQSYMGWLLQYKSRSNLLLVTIPMQGLALSQSLFDPVPRQRKLQTLQRS